jgi:hypothetical protein
MSRSSRLLILPTIAATSLLTAGPTASAQEPPDDQQTVSAEPTVPLPVETTWLSSGAVAATDQVATVSDRRPSPDTGIDAVVAAGDADAAPVPLDDLISNYGCTMVEADPGTHRGVNCIDDGWLNTDGTVYVHTTVPAAQQVRFSSIPPAGTADDGTPTFAAFDVDTAPDYSSYEFTSKAFAIQPARTYHILALAWDGEGNMAWRYGTATVPHTATVVIDEITVLNDGDEYSWNQGEIEFGMGIEGHLLWTFPEESFDDGDSFDPAAHHVGEGSPHLVEIFAWAREDDPGKCVVEATELVDDYQDGGGCHFAQAVETFDLTTDPPSLDVDFTSPHEHLRIRVEGHITLSIP